MNATTSQLALVFVFDLLVNRAASGQKLYSPYLVVIQRTISHKTFSVYLF